MNKEITSVELKSIATMVHFIRGQRVMFGQDLAVLYGVETKVLIQAVKRNKERFPADFVFQLSFDEVRDLKSQIVTSSAGPAQRALPYAFTEQGVAMLSSVLRSKEAVQVNVAIMRAFVQMRRMIETNQELVAKIDDLEKKYDKHFRLVFTAIRQLMKEEANPKTLIGFREPVEE
jgi:hypothetical protein